MKKIINALLCAALLVSNITAVTYAEEAGTGYYTQIDISGNANAPIYIEEGDAHADYIATAPNKNYGIQMSEMKELKNKNDMTLSDLYGKNIFWENEWTNDTTKNTLNLAGTPYLMEVAKGTNVAINTGGRSGTFSQSGKGVTDYYNYKGTDVDVADGYYNSLKILASASGDWTKTLLENNGFSNVDLWANTAKLGVVLQYADGTSEVIECLTTNPLQDSWWTGAKDFPADAVKTENEQETVVRAAGLPNVSELSKDNYFNGFGKFSVLTAYGSGWQTLGSSTYSKDHNGYTYAYMNEYTLPVDNTKKLQNIHIVGSCADYTGIVLKADGTVDYTNATARYNAANYGGGSYEGMYSSIVYAITGVTDAADVQTALSAKLAALENTEAVTEDDVTELSDILNQAENLGIVLGENADNASRIINDYYRTLDEKKIVYTTVDITPYANQAAYTNVADLPSDYIAEPTIGISYDQDSNAYNIGIDAEKFKRLVNRNGITFEYINHFSDKTLAWKDSWDTNTSNTLLFGETPYLIKVATNAKTNIDTGAPAVRESGVDVNIADGYYKELKILASGMHPNIISKLPGYENWTNVSKLALKLDYADGSFDVVDYFINEYATAHSKVLGQEKITGIINRNGNNESMKNPSEPVVRSYSADGTLIGSTQEIQLTQAQWWQGFGNMIALRNTIITDDRINAQTTMSWEKDAINALSEEQLAAWKDGTITRYVPNDGELVGINEFTVPVNQDKMLTNVHFVGSLADTDAVSRSFCHGETSLMSCRKRRWKRVFPILDWHVRCERIKNCRKCLNIWAGAAGIGADMMLLPKKS